jgi:hypothetical protein
MGCGGAAETKHPADQLAPSFHEAPSTIEGPEETKNPRQELLKLIREFTSSVSTPDTLDIWGLIEDFHETAAFILTETNINRLDAFVAELSKDETALENIVAVKNAFLKPSEGTCMHPAGQQQTEEISWIQNPL